MEDDMDRPINAKDSHELISIVKDLAIELGRSPRKAEFEARVVNGRGKLDLFGGFTVLLKAAGLDTYDDRRSAKKLKLNNTIWERNIEEHLEQYRPRPTVDLGPYPTAAIISDIHWPFQSDRVIEKFLDYVETNQPEWVIINGDAWDQYSFSKYPRSHNLFTPREELRLARVGNEAFWKEVQKRSPKSKCVQMMGNHDIRALKQTLEHLPVAEDWVKEKLTELFSFEGVHTVMDPREEFFLRDDIIVMHGYRTKLGDHRDFTLMSCFIGHTHKGGVVWRTIGKGRQIFECNSGVAGDPESKGLSYTSQKIHNMTPGFAAMDGYGPRFIPV
jgi:predicted phosphodiesterase